MMRNNQLASRGLIFLGLTLFLFFVGRAYWSYLHSPADPKSQQRAFIVQTGESVGSVAGRLEEKGLIRSAWAFKLTLKRSGRGDQIEAGNFKLSPAMSMKEIVRNLQAGSSDKWITLIEGWRIEEMAEEFNSKFKIQSASWRTKFIAAAKKHEGYLFPDTYLFNPEVSVEDIITILRNNFDKKYDQAIQAKIKKLGLTPQQGVILASIVEREARNDEPRKMVASILLKRFNSGMGLQADATIQYALGYQSQEKSWWKRHLTKDDLLIESAYNTYLYRGLTPLPIANPSLSSLEAVANADPSTPYLYYYHDSQGRSYYAKTLDEHNANAANNP